MSVKLQDRSLIVTYIQVFLNEYFGLSLKKISNAQSLKYGLSDNYEISRSDSIKITGVYNLQTYLSVSLWMHYNYPNELFPVRYDPAGEGSLAWEQTPFDTDKLVLTMNKIIPRRLDISYSVIPEQTYLEIIDNDTKTYFDWNTLLKYFYTEEHLKDVLFTKENTDKFEEEDINQSMIVFLSNNMYRVLENRDVVTLSNRIISYFLNEVVSPQSEDDEVLRTQKLIYPEGVDYLIAGRYTDELMNKVKEYQQKFIDEYTSNKGEDNEVISLPKEYEGFKVTGYVDPWTELVIKGGID